jgi:hypothetical protein
VRFRALIAALGTSVVLALAGCGSSDPASSGPVSSGPTGSSSGQTPASTQPAPAQGKTIDVCTALSATAASQITGTTFTNTKSNSVEGVVFGCDYGGPDSALLQVSVDTQDGKGVFDADITALKAVNHPPTRVSGVGDEAFSEPNPNGNAGSEGAAGFASYGAVFGDTYIKIGGLTYVTPGHGKQIVEMLHSKL